jgi:predicted AAA+ superfamily ATPase
MRETDKQMKETGKKIGALGDSIGKLVEHIMSAGIVRKFRDLGYTFTRSNHRIEYEGPDGQLIAEVDILLENGDYILPVEVKTSLKTEDIKYHTRRMEVLRNYSTEHGDYRTYIGGVTGGVISKAARDLALKKGFYVIELSGDTLRIKAPDHVQVWKAGA